MFHIEIYTEQLQNRLQRIFGSRLVYLGLQGSYLRNEQHENSDIDIMAVIDRMTADDLQLYKDALMEVGYYEKSCGFICGRDELSHWNPLEICHLLHTTKDIYGVLSDHLPPYTLEDEKNFIKLSIGNLYHELCHRYIHAGREKNIAGLPGSCKALFFILQNLVFIRTGAFYPSRNELIRHLEGQDKEVLSIPSRLQNDREASFDEAFRLLLSWCQNTLAHLSA